MFWIVITAILFIAYSKEISALLNKAKGHIPMYLKKGRAPEILSFPNNYTAEVVNVVDYENFCKDYSLGHNDNDFYLRDRFVVRKCIVFSDGGLISVKTKDAYWEHWLGVHQQAQCAHIQRKDSEGIVVESYYLPSAFSLYFNIETGRVEC